MKDFNDAWILDGLLPYFLIFLFAYSLLVGFSTNLKLVTLVSSIFLVVVNLIPSLKYSFIYGTQDAMGHYGFINEMVKTGHVPQFGVYKIDYGSTPGLQIFVSAISILSSLDTCASMKVFLVVAPSVLPLIVFVVGRRLNVSGKLSKLMVISTTVTSPTTYIFTGTTSIYFLYAFFSCFLVLFFIYDRFDRRYLVMTVILGLAILFSHEATIIYLLVIFAVILVGQRIVKSIRSQTALMIFWIAAHLSFLIFCVAGFDLTKFIAIAQQLVSPLAGKEVPFASHYGGFFKLTLYDEARVLTVELAKNLVTGLLCVLSIPVALKMRAKKDETNRLYYVLVLFSVVPAAMFLASSGGMVVKYRFWTYFSPFTPFLVGIALWFFFYRQHPKNLARRRPIILAVFVFVLICISTVQTYPFQPLVVPQVKTEYGERYVVNFLVYVDFSQRSFISFLAKYNSRLSMSASSNVWWQIYGLTQQSFQELLTVHGEKQGTLILISDTLPDSSSASMEIENYTREAPKTENGIYTNGKSYCFYKPYD
jgi:hypothetical protein